MTLKSSEILQVDATVITGVLILLTVTGPELANRTIFRLSSQQGLEKLPMFLTVMIILPFVISILMIAQLELKVSKGQVTGDYEKKKLRQAIINMALGFIYLLIALLILILSQ